MTTMTIRDKLRTLLPHWMEHNAQHAADFRRWAELAGEPGDDILTAADQMEAANKALAAALEKLGGPAEHSRLHE
jgi:hypothetical protein